VCRIVVVLGIALVLPPPLALQVALVLSLRPPAGQEPVLALPPGLEGTLKRNMQAPGQWLASSGVTSTPQMVVGSSRGKMQIRSTRIPISQRSRRAVMGVQYMGPAVDQCAVQST
jgi:hypothetical protein